MPASVQIGLLIAVPTGLFIALLRMPRWFFRSLHRHRLWRLHDQLSLDMISGRLPKDHQAVKDLRDQTRRIIEDFNSFTMLKFSVHMRIWRRCDVEFRRRRTAQIRDRLAALEGLTPKQVRLLRAHRERLLSLGTGSLLLGSWVGIANVLRYFPTTMLEAHRRQRGPERTRIGLDAEFRETVVLATARASRDTRLGQHSRQLVEHEADASLVGAV